MSLFDDDDIENNALDAVEAKESALNAPTIPDPRANPALIAHAEIEKQLLEWWEAGTMPHALVLAGPQGIGKATLAFRLARFLFVNPQKAESGLFGAEPTPTSLNVPATDPVFHRVAAAGHSDLMTLARTVNEKTGHLRDDILVDDVRAVPLFLRKTAGEGGWRVVIIDQAESLNRNAQNALLKILEEPPTRALLILVTQTAGALIPTIRSRARVLTLEALSAEDFTALMRQYRPDLTSADIDLLARISGNAPGRALALLEQGGPAAITNTVQMLSTLPGTEDSALWTLAEKLSVKGEPDALMAMLDVAAWALRDQAEAAASQNNASGVKTTLQTLDALERHRAMCDKGNLDRRHTALGALRILQQGLRGQLKAA